MLVLLERVRDEDRCCLGLKGKRFPLYDHITWLPRQVTELMLVSMVQVWDGIG